MLRDMVKGRHKEARQLGLPASLYSASGHDCLMYVERLYAAKHRDWLTKGDVTSSS